jgi:hypothetical protein
VQPPPDDKDWTWVLTRPCPDCGFDAARVHGRDVPALVRDAVERWQLALQRPDVGRRPSPTVWSVLEYGCHTRDVLAVFAERALLMLGTEEAVFANWDQDETAVTSGYARQDPSTVARELAGNGDMLASTYAAVAPDQWHRQGTRSDGSVFTVDSLGRYVLHDLAHHLVDIDA